MATLETPLVGGMIHRPDRPAHMMRIKPLGREVTVRYGDEVIARSRRALMLIEIGSDVYDPAFYLPLDDVTADLVPMERSTHCPLKGDTTYYDLGATDARGTVEEFGWSYTEPLEWAADLRGMIAFDPSRARLDIAPIER